MPIINTAITVIPDQYKIMLENYVSIVEKTNNQLGLWLSLSNIAVGILSIIIAIVAILVGYALWKNSDEQKKKFEKSLKTQEIFLKEQINKFEELAKRGREEAEKKLETLIAENQEKLVSATASNKKEIQKAIDDLKKEKATIGTYINPNTIFSTGSPSFSITTGPTGYSVPLSATSVSGVFDTTSASAISTRCCSRCGRLLSLGSTYCPFCGNHAGTL